MHRTFAIAIALIIPVLPLEGQSAFAACAAAGDSTYRQVVRTFDELRVCMLALPADGALGDDPRAWMTTALRVVLETQRPGDFRRMSIGISSGRVDWAVNGQLKDHDASSNAWRSAVVGLLARADEADDLRGRVSALRLQIDSLPQLRSRTADEITAIERRAVQLNQAIVKLQSDDRGVRTQISQMEQRMRTLEGVVSRETAAAARATDANTRTRAENAARQAEMEIARLNDQLRRIERQRFAIDAERRIPLMEQELADLRPDHAVALLRMKLGNYDAVSIPALERELTGMEADIRLRALDGEIAQALSDLRGVLGPPPESSGIR